MTTCGEVVLTDHISDNVLTSCCKLRVISNDVLDYVPTPFGSQCGSALHEGSSGDIIYVPVVLTNHIGRSGAIKRPATLNGHFICSYRERVPRG